VGGHLVQQGATVICGHAGQAKPNATNARVKLAGQAAVSLTAPWQVSGCSLPPNAGGPCASAQWTAGTVRVTSQGQPLVIQGGSATCVPTGVPLTVTVAQMRVTAS
jgi:hypothetical protein